MKQNPFSFCRLEQFGGLCDCQSTRDTFLYASSVEKSGLASTVELLGDVILRPRLKEEEIELARSAVEFDIEVRENVFGR